MGLSLSFPILEHLSPDGLSNISEDLDCFENAPNLHSVATNSSMDTVEKSAVTWHRLNLMDVCATRNDNLDVLRQFPALTILKRWRYWSTFEPSTIPLAKLQSFTFIDCKNVQECEMLENIRWFQRSLIWPQNAFNAFISRLSCKLTTLSLSIVTISDLDLVSALRLLPSLTSFSTEDLENAEGGSPITSHFISSMHSSSPAPLLPKLLSLSIKLFGTSFDDTAFVSVISSRWMPGYSVGIDCLRSLVLCFSEREIDKEVYKPLWDLDRQGMRVFIAGINYKGQ
ncbi:hypothetical protein BT96DRAFT_992390 [Gymnopus androsaceus JB14]|uniref:F-box domain-containing protein n=1 Tax=Gymnopus androsaceus JB14 TaxID=1447944 RepID=A0A6A4HST6_9AGAR|nr:hypothetical protein BT96DRAFT_992390 [Gymnopus androsaceus JB14]